MGCFGDDSCGVSVGAFVLGEYRIVGVGMEHGVNGVKAWGLGVWSERMFGGLCWVLVRMAFVMNVTISIAFTPGCLSKRNLFLCQETVSRQVCRLKLLL